VSGYVFSSHSTKANAEIAALFRTTFADSEGEEEGQTIFQLALDLLERTPLIDLHVFVANADDHLVGCALFSRLVFSQNSISAWLLSPVAVEPTHQNKGIGSDLIRHGLSCLKQEGVDVVFTYGDPSFYCRLGFVPVDQNKARAPFVLTMPQGWLAVPLSSLEIGSITGSSQCVQALRQSKYW